MSNPVTTPLPRPARKLTAWCLIALLGVWLAGGMPSAHAATITLCADVWCPYNCIPGSSHPGFAVEIAREVFRAAGYSVEYRRVSWARCIDDARAGRFSGIIGALPTDAPDFTYPAEPIGISSTGFAVRAGDNFHFTGARSMDGRVLGVVRDYAFSGPIGDYIAAHANDRSRIEFVSGDGALTVNLQKLLAHRIDVVVDDWNVLRTTIADLGLAPRISIENAHDGDAVYIGFSPAEPQHKALARILDAGIRRLRASGRLAKILAEYQIADWSPSLSQSQ